MASTEEVLLGVYQQMGGVPYRLQQMIMYPEMAGNLVPLEDINSNGNPNYNRYFEAHNLNVDPLYETNNLKNLYTSIYTLLFNVNDLLAALPEVPDGTPEEKASLRGEALHLRAVAHFDLVRLFAQAPAFTPSATHLGIALITEPGTVLQRRSRATVAEVYELIVSDLEEAIITIDPAQSIRTNQPIWVSPEVARAALTQVQGYAGRWAEVLRLSTEILEGTGTQLTPSGEYVEQWQSREVAETIWEIDVQRFNDAGSVRVSDILARVASLGVLEPYARISDDLFNLFESDDIRRGLYPVGRFGRQSTKYPGSDFDIRNPPVFRLSTIYLWRAEAAARLGDFAQAREDYDRIHQRAVPTASPTNLDGAALLEEILLERRRELALEGDLLFDLARRGADIERTDCNLSVRFCSLPYPSPYFILPIPEDALDRNENLTQNEGY